MEVFDDFGGEGVGGGEVGGVFEAFVAEPEDVKAGFVAGDDFVVGVGAPTAFGSLFGPQRLAVVPILAGSRLLSILCVKRFRLSQIYTSLVSVLLEKE